MRKALAVSILILALGAFFAPAVHAQGCVMCYTSAAGQDPAAARKLDMAILALLIPVLALFVGVLSMAIQRRDSEVSDPPVDDSQLPISSLNDSGPLLADERLPRGSVVRLHLELPPSAGD